MIREDRELLVELARVNSQVHEFVLAFLDGRLSQAEQLTFGQKLVALGETITSHARQRDKFVVDGSVVGVGIPVDASGHRPSPTEGYAALDYIVTASQM